MSMESRIQTLRKLKKLTQGELSELTKIPLRTLNKVENGKGDLSTEQLKNLSSFFGVSADYLLTGKEGTSEINEDERLLLETLREDKSIAMIVMDIAKVKKKAINYLSHYQQQHAHAA